MSEVVQYRVVRPDGTVLYWETAIAGLRRFPSLGQSLILGDLKISPPWRVEVRTADSDWQVIEDSDTNPGPSWRPPS